MEKFRIRALYLALGLAIGVCAALFYSTKANAGPGGLAADGCHKHKADVARTWHIPGTQKTGGICVDKGGASVKELAGAVTKAAYEAVTAERDRLRVQIRAMDSRLDKARVAQKETRAYAERIKREYRSLISAAERERRDVAKMKRDAVILHEEAAARERGSGPKSSRGCRNAVRTLLDATMFSRGAARDSLRDACLE